MLAKEIRAAAKRKGIGVEALRLKARLGGGTFYELLRGAEPRTVKVIRKLQSVGVRIPEALLTA